MEKGTLASLIKRNFVPVVLVLCTDDAEAVMKKNSTNLSSLLSRFAFSTQPIKVKTIGEQPYEIKGFQVRFVTLKELEARCAPSHEQEARAHQYLSQVASRHASERTYGDGFQLREKADVPLFQRALQGKDPTPWFSFYRWEYIRSLGVSEFEFFEHPIAFILAVSSENEKPNDALVSLFDDRNPPAIFRTGVMDPTLTKYYLLVHDNQTENNADKKLAQMKTVFEKSKCHLLKVNSLPAVNEQGSLLSQDDLKGVENFTREFVFKSLVPQMEKLIASYNEYVDSTRKGIRNTFKSLLGWKKTKPEKGPTFPTEAESTGNTTYALSSVESCQKRLADYLFMLQDYNEALNVYKNASKDYQNDKTFKYHGAAQEMAGLCSFLLDPSRKDIEAFFEASYGSYIKDNLNRFSVRSTLFCSEILKMRRNLLGAAVHLGRAADKESDKLCSAMLQEQAAFCFLYMNPPQFRKYAFRLIMAGHCFNLKGQNEHAIRCYLATRPIYELRNWSFVDDHMCYVLARQSFLLGHLEDAMVQIQRLLEKNSQSPHKQSSYLREFLHIVAKRSAETGNTMPVLSLPSINNDTVTIFLRDYPPKSPLQEVWKAMEKSLKNEGKVPKKRTKYKTQAKKKEVDRIAVVGESIDVDVELTNPLQVPLQFTHMQLVGDHSFAKQGEPQEIPQDSPLVRPNDSKPDPAFHVSPFDILLAPNETKKIHFSICPLKEGVLKIRGIGFCLCGVVWGCREFKLPQKRLNETKEQRKGVFYEPNMDLTIKITGAMPLMDVEFQRFPTHMLQGQLEKVAVDFRNSGKSNLNNIRVKLSNPSFFSFGTPDGKSTADPTSCIRGDGSIVHMAIKSLAPGASVSVPLWIRAHKVGQHQFQFLYCYESENVNPEMKYRLHRSVRNLRVLPSLKMTPGTHLSYSSINAYLLNLEIANIQSSAEFQVRQISSVSRGWRIEPLSNKKESGTQQSIWSIAPEQSTNLFFRIVPVEDENQGEVCHTNHTVSESMAVPRSLDITDPEAPYQDFLRREKCFISEKKKHETAVVPTPSDASVNEQIGLDLTILWETALESGGSEKIVLIGQQNVCNVSFLSATTVDKSVTNNEALRFSIESPRKVEHDFSSESFCVVSVTFHVNNRSPTTPLSFRLETLKPHENLESTQANTSQIVQKRSQYFWSGTTQHYVSDLQPEAKVALDANVCFPRAGVYNLNRYKFVILDSKGRVTQQIHSPFQHIIIVEDSNEMQKS